MLGKNFSWICMALHLSGLLVTFRAPISSVKRTLMSAASGRLLVSSELINASVAAHARAALWWRFSVLPVKSPEIWGQKATTKIYEALM